jgi:AcrR family transcriptional regulator
MKAKTQFQNLGSPGRSVEFNMDDALEQAIHIFSERGFHATSIADLAEATGLSVGHIYKAFADKRAFFLAALDHQSGQRNKELALLLAEAHTGRDKLKVLLVFYAGMSSAAEGRRGSLMVGAALELIGFDRDVAQRVAASQQQLEKLLGEMIEQGRADGSLASSAEVQASARFLLCFLQGLRVVGRTAPPRADMLAAVDVALAALS